MSIRVMITIYLVALISFYQIRNSEASAPYPKPFPSSCMVNFSPPDNPLNHGFLKVGRDGHFHWENGKRARFWGINVSSTRLILPPAQIEYTVQTFSDAGINLVRLEAIDNRNCLLGPQNSPDSLHFNLKYLDCLDHWIADLHQHNICCYLDLLDLRTFKPGDGVVSADELHRAARPMAMFDPLLIQLQEQYAKHLLQHKNPYTGLRLIDDMNLAMVEICNENGFFLDPDRLETMPRYYSKELNILWNRWLLKRYGNRNRLEYVWGKFHGVSTLRPDEDPGDNSVDMPLLSPSPGEMPANVADVRRSPARLHDGVLFLCHIQRSYFRTLYNYLHSIGLKIPITGVVSSSVPPDVASAGEVCDFTAENWYGESVTPDKQNPNRNYYGNHDPLKLDGADGFAPFSAILRQENKPVVLREWAVTWPNQFRAASVPEVLAYASLQDYDAVILFGYQTNKALNGAEPDALNNFAVQNDPSVWGLYAAAGQAFLHHAIRRARDTFTIAYPLNKLYSWPIGLTDLARAAWSVQLRTVYHAAHGSREATPRKTSTDDRRVAALLASLHKRGRKVIPDSIHSGIWRSDTGQITLNSRRGLLIVSAPTIAIIAGEFQSNHIYRAGGLRLRTATRCGALIALSLDGKPLMESQRLLIKMVSTAKNTGEVFTHAPAGSPDSWELISAGTAPVITSASPSPNHPTCVWFENARAKKHDRSLLAMPMKNGTWELLISGEEPALISDLPGLPARVLGKERLSIAYAH